MNKVLVVVDMQNDFVDEEVLGNEESIALIEPIKKRIAEAAEDGDFVVFLRDTHGEDYLETAEGKALPFKHCIEGTRGHRLISGLFPDCPMNYVIPNKSTFGNLDWSCLGGAEGIEEIELCGIFTDICVISNALILKSMFPEIPIKVQQRLCAATSSILTAPALLIMEQCQINIEW